MSDRPSMVFLTAVSGSFAAHVLQARLADEGVEAELRGAVDGPYPFSVGALAEVAVYVPDDQLDDARLVLLAAEVDAAVEPPPDSSLPARRNRRREVVTVLIVMALLVMVGLARVLAAAG